MKCDHQNTYAEKNGRETDQRKNIQKHGEMAQDQITRSGLDSSYGHWITTLQNTVPQLLWNSFQAL